MTISIKNPQETLFSGECTSAIFPGSNGQFQILPGHCQIMAELSAGKIVVQTADGKRNSLNIDGGILDMKDNKAIVLAD